MGGSRNEYGGVALRRMLLFLTLAIVMVVATSSGRWPKHKKPVRKRHTVVGTITRREAGVGITGAITQPNFTGIPSSLGSRSKAFRKAKRHPHCPHPRAAGTTTQREALGGITGAPTPPSFTGIPSSWMLRSTNASYRLHRRTGAVKPRLSIGATYVRPRHPCGARGLRVLVGP